MYFNNIGGGCIISIVRKTKTNKNKNKQKQEPKGRKKTRFTMENLVKVAVENAVEKFVEDVKNGEFGEKTVEELTSDYGEGSFDNFYMQPIYDKYAVLDYTEEETVWNEELVEEMRDYSDELLSAKC